MPDESRSRLARIAAWWRRGVDAEMLALAPDVDEAGEPLVWDFARPVNRSPLWRLVRPWVLIPTLVAGLFLAIAFAGRTQLPTLSEVAAELAFTIVPCSILGLVIRRRSRKSTERAALKAYRHHRWRGTRALDATIAAALAEQRSAAMANAERARER